MDKLEQLKSILKQYQKIAIAYSGGCDSNFLLKVASLVLGKENVYAIICKGAMVSNEDFEDALNQLQGHYYKVVEVDPLSVKEFANNHPRRCYFCKKMIMSKVIEEANASGFDIVCDGQNQDDLGVYRPGIQACQELHIVSPLSMCQMTKKEIREYSKMLSIETYNKPSNACLATRFDYGVKLTQEELLKVEKAEKLFHDLGIFHVRVRKQGQLARIEVERSEFNKVIENTALISQIKALGFKFVTLDLEGIRSGGYDNESKGNIGKG